MSRGERITALALSAWAIACVGLVAFRFVNDPMRDRFRALEQRLGAIAHVEEDFVSPDDTVSKAVHFAVANKSALWSELIAPPPKKTASPKAEPKPDLLQKLQGVRASLRQEIVAPDGSRTVKITSPQNQSGRWMGVGGKINGLVISEITDDAVVFMLQQGEKAYTVELPRK